jgi:hypothetical protein
MPKERHPPKTRITSPPIISSCVHPSSLRDFRRRHDQAFCVEFQRTRKRKVSPTPIAGLGHAACIRRATHSALLFCSPAELSQRLPHMITSTAELNLAVCEMNRAVQIVLNGRLARQQPSAKRTPPAPTNVAAGLMHSIPTSCHPNPIMTHLVCSARLSRRRLEMRHLLAHLRACKRCFGFYNRAVPSYRTLRVKSLAGFD